MPNLTGHQPVLGSRSFIRGTPWANWWVIEQDHANNRSRIGVEMTINAGVNSWAQFHERGAYWLNGRQVNFDNGRQARSGNFLVFRHEHNWVDHDVNGNLNVSLTADCWVGDAKFLVENVNGSVPRLGKAPDIRHLNITDISHYGMTLLGEIMNHGRGTSTQLQTQVVKSGDGWSAGGYREWQNDALGDNRWSITGLAPNTDYSARMIVRNNNGDQNATGEHKKRTLAISNIVRHIENSPTMIQLSLKTPASLNNCPVPTTKIEVNGGKGWEVMATAQKVGDWDIQVPNLIPNKTYQIRTAVENSSGVWRSEPITVKTLPACVIIKRDGTVLNCVPYLIKKTGEIVGLDPRVIRK